MLPARCYTDNIEAAGIAGELPVQLQKAGGSSANPCLFAGSNRVDGRTEFVVAAVANFHKHQGEVSVQHDQVQFPERTGEVAGNRSQTMTFEKSFGDPFLPGAEPAGIYVLEKERHKHIPVLGYFV